MRLVVAAFERRVARLLGPGSSCVVALPDRGGRLRTVRSSGERTPGAAAPQRRWVFESGEAVRIPVPGSPGRAVAVLPLLVSSERVGVVQVMAPAPVLEERWHDLGRLASGAAALVRRIASSVGGEADDVLETALVRQLLSASSVGEALAPIPRSYQARFAVPAAAWRRDPDRPGWRLVAVAGLDGARRAVFRKDMRTLPEPEAWSEQERARLFSRFVALTGATWASMLRTPDALVVVGCASVPVRRSLRALRPVLEDVLRHLDLVSWALRRDRSLDLGMACTLHELRGPLVASRAAIGHVVGTEAPSVDLDLLRRSEQELDHMLELVETLLPWTVGLRPLDPRPLDLADVVRQAVASCELETGERRVDLDVPPGRLVAVADEPALRGAVANLVRNALAYSPPATEVKVAARAQGGSVTIVVRDSGGGISRADGRAIFDPFVRGEAGRRSRHGSGLGLFLARRVVEAHDGDIWAESDGTGARFTIRLPAAVGLAERDKAGAGVAEVGGPREARSA